MNLRPVSCRMRAVRVSGGIERQRRVRVGAAGAHLRRHPDRLHQLGFRGALAQGGLRVASDAVRALGDVGDGDGDQLLGLLVQRAVREDLPAERLKRIMGGGCEFPAAMHELAGRDGIDGFVHVDRSCP